MLESLFNTVACLKACNYIKKRLQHRGFPVNIGKLLRTAFFFRTFLVAASDGYNLLEQKRFIFTNYVFFLRKGHLQESTFHY